MAETESPSEGAGNGGGSPDLEVIRALARLTGGDFFPFAEAVDPPDTIAQWLREADSAQVNGLLIQTLRRWNELKRS